MKSHIIGPQLPAQARTLGLGDQIREYAKVIDKRIDYVHRNLAIVLFTAIVYDTPVATGLARGSWWPSKQAPIMGGPTRLDPSGSEVTRDIQRVVMSAKLSDVLFLMNNVPYIEALEYGWSKRAPEGMVRINVARVRRMVSDTIQSAKEIK